MKRLGLVRLSAMGDVVQSLGAASALQRARPELEIHFVTQRGFEPLLDGLGFASVIGHDRRAGFRGWRRTRSVLAALRLDAVVDLQGNWKSALACCGVMMIREKTFARGAPGSIRAKSMTNSELEWVMMTKLE